MDVGMVGLGRMGGGMARRLALAGHRVLGFDVNPAAASNLERDNVSATPSLSALVAELPSPRTTWIMLPAGTPTEETVQSLALLLDRGDTVIDGGNCHYRDSQRRASLLSDRGIAFIDVGTSGGLAGEAGGYCLMIGGESEAVLRHQPIFQALAPAGDRGWGHVGPPGSGHFVKMVHNAVEYGLMEAYAEGFEILKAKTELGVSLAQVAEIWCHGSVIRSWLLELCARMLAKDEKLDDVRGWVADTGEGRWTVSEAIALDLSVPVITDSLLRRLRSRETDPFGDKMLAAMRREFGGHEVHSAD